MAPRLPPSSGSSAQPAAPVAVPVNQQQYQSAATPQASTRTTYSGYVPPSSAAVATPPPPPEGSGDGGGERRERRRREDFANLAAGDYTFVCAVDSILDFGYGTTVTFSVVVGPERDRELQWGQTPPPFCLPPAPKAATSMSIWFRTMCEAYAACGFPFETAWFDTGQKTALGDPIKVPPYWAFFVHECADGVHVPVLVNVRVRVDPGYEKYAKVQSVALYLIDGRPVQAPMPRKVSPGIEKAHRWTGVIESINTKNGSVEAVKLDWKQIGLGHGGLKTYRDVR